MNWHKLKHVLGCQRGQTIVLIAISMVVLLGMAALVVDIGSMAFERNRLQASADAAALAGAASLPDETAAKTVAGEYLQKNLGNGYTSVITVTNNSSRIAVDVKRNVKFSFAPVFGGGSNGDVNVSAVAMNYLAKGLRPFGLYDDPTEKYVEGESITLRFPPKGNEDKSKDNKDKSKDNTDDPAEPGPGNYALVDLWDPGWYNLGECIRYGSLNEFSKGEEIQTQTGQDEGQVTPEIESLLADFDGGPVYVFIPLVNTLGVNGSSTDITITGFAIVKVTDTSVDGKEINGVFEEYVSLNSVSTETQYPGGRIEGLVRLIK